MLTSMRWLFFIPLFVFCEMTLEEKIGQLFVAPAFPLHRGNHFDDWKVLIHQYHVGSAIMKQSDVESQIRFLNRLNQEAGSPLFVMGDIEWGLSMRMSGVPRFPKNMALGKVQDLGLIEAMGEEIAREARLVGIHMTLGPVVDVNNNPKNPIIHLRSFGEDAGEVGKRAAAMIRGLHRGGLMTCIKHFPGHGDTEVDSHVGLPVILHALNEVELPPFKEGITAGSEAVMTAHILLPEFDEVPATLSKPIVTDLLRGELGHQGLIIADALNMRALTNQYSVEEIAIRAHAAGVDLLLYGSHLDEVVDELVRDQIPRAYQALLTAYKEGVFPMERLNESVSRILRAKEHLPSEPLSLNPPLMTPDTKMLQEALYDAIVTRIGPEFAPIDIYTAYLSFGQPTEDLFPSAFCPCACTSWEDRAELFDCARVVVTLFTTQLTDEELEFCRELAKKTEVAFCLFGSPYFVPNLPEGSTIFLAFDEWAQNAVLKHLTTDL
jgi:beta-N-acetylhexosaminidase